jgi:transcriptional regulator with XRE-family HTH domain
MNNIGKKIKEVRKLRGYSQEQLADLSNLNLRTVQRIENDVTIPRGKTLHLLCEVLDMEVQDLTMNSKNSEKKSWFAFLLNLIFLALLNLLLAFIIGAMTLDSEANLNSRFGGFLLSFLIPFMVVYYTQDMNPAKRVFKFGSGYLFYFISLFSIQGWHNGLAAGVQTGLFLCLILAIGTLFYGKVLLKKE